MKGPRHLYGMKPFLRIAALATLLAGTAFATETSLFPLESAGKGEPCALSSGRTLSTGAATLNEAEGRRGLQLGGETSLSLSPRNATDPLGEGLSELTISLAFHADDVAPYPVYFERMTKGGRGVPGFFYFYSQTRRGTPAERETDLRFAFTGPDGERRLFVSPRRLTVRQGEWRQVACVIGGGKIAFYVDGAPLGEPVAFEEPIPPLPKPWWFRSGADFTGMFRQLLVAPRALEPEQISSLHQNASLSPELQAQLP